MISYRADVDGLRAIAILSVVAYHAHEPWLPGGFIGVDVFFVISGYLITKLIAGEMAQDRFSVARFYVRRTKRIFPALFVVLLTTLLLGLFLLTPTDLAELGRTMAATAAFVSNVVFWGDTGYFDVAAERKPLLHTWSLAVEEQFYLLWPLVLYALFKSRIALRPVIAAALLLSFAISCYAAVRHPSSAFFLLPSRAWELLIGAALALGMAPPLTTAAQRNASALIGLSLIVTGLFAIDRTSAFPAWNALLPCLGTGLLLHAGEQGDHIVARNLLARRPMVFVGLISYSLYLWHWPLLSLARVVNRGTLATSSALVVVAVAVILSVLSWRFVEQPLRARRTTPLARPVLLRYVAASLAFFALGSIVYAADGFLAYAAPGLARAERARFDGNPLSGSCLRWQAEAGPLPGEQCMSQHERFEKSVVLWGDSHADAVAPGVVDYATKHGHSTYQLTMAACPPLVGVEVAGPGISYEACTNFNREVLKFVTGTPSADTVVLAARWPLYTENARFGPDDPGPITYLVDQPGEPLSSPASRRAFSRSMAATLDALHAAGKKVIVLGTIPPLGTNIPECLARNHMPFSGIVDCSVDSSAVLPHMKFADSEIERLTSNRAGVCSYLPSRALCASGRCVEQVGDAILYANDDHLSSPGALYLSRHFSFTGCISDAALGSSLKH